MGNGEGIGKCADAWKAESFCAIKLPRLQGAGQTVSGFFLWLRAEKTQFFAIE